MEFIKAILELIKKIFARFSDNEDATGVIDDVIAALDEIAAIEAE